MLRRPTFDAPAVAGVCAALLLVLAGCGQRAANVAMPGAPAMSTRLLEAAPASSPAQAMVREHAIELEVGSDAIGATVDRLVAACTSRPNAECLLLSTRRSGGEYPSGEVQMRLAPVAVQPTIAAVGTMGRVVSQTTTASDVTESLADGAARLKTLQSYRTQLEKLQASARDVDALIKIANELARTQTEIDALSSEREATLARTRTERLTVAVRSPYAAGGSRAIGDAIRNFGGNVLAVIATMITVLSGLLPIAVVLAAAWWLWRAWRRRARAR